MFEIIMALLTGYLAGSVFISYFWGKLKGMDLTCLGTGQLGGSNAGRFLGWPAMVITGIFDISKGLFTLLIADYFLINIESRYSLVALVACSAGIILGHVYSFWLLVITRQQHGGKGAAPLGGIVLFISWESFLITYVVLMVILLLVKKWFISNKTIYDNFITNGIVVSLLPLVILFFTGDVLKTLWIILLIAIIAFNERQKLYRIIFKRKNDQSSFE